MIVGSWTFPVEQLPAAGPPFDFASPFEAQQERTAGFGAEQQDRAAVGALQQHLPESRRLGEHWQPDVGFDAIQRPGSPHAVAVYPISRHQTNTPRTACESRSRGSRQSVMSEKWNIMGWRDCADRTAKNSTHHGQFRAAGVFARRFLS